MGNKLMKRIVALVLSVAAYSSVAMEVSTGTLHQIQNFQSKYVAAKHVYVWLPDGYDRNRTYPVLYMHDGQALFDAKTTWNKQEWGIDEVAGKLIKEGKVEPFIVVASTNADFFGEGKRMNEYFPQKAFESLPKKVRKELLGESREGALMFKGDVYSDRYLKFMVEELKPYIDKTFSVKSDRDNTFVMGSSMGGLISMYAISEYPEVFGAAACISTHWPGATPREGSPIPQAFFDYMKKNLPDPATHRIYFDLGTETLDQYYPPLQKQADVVMREKGFGPGSWETRTFEGAAHDEVSWQKRLHIPLLFLLNR